MARTKFTRNCSSDATTDTQTASTTTTTVSSAQMVVEALLNSLPAKFTYSEQRTETRTHRRTPQHKEQEQQEQHERRADPDYEPESESESESDSESDWEPYKNSAKRKRASKHTRTHKNTKKAARGVCPLGTGLPTPTQEEAEAETKAETKAEARAVAGPETWALDVPLDKEGRVVSPQSPTVHGCAHASVGGEFLRHYGMSLVLLEAKMTVLEQEVTFLAGKVDSLVKFQPASFYTFGLRQTALKNYVRELLDCVKLRELLTTTGNWLVDVDDMDVNIGAYAGLTIPKELVRKTVVARAMVQRGHSSVTDAIVSLQQLLLKHVVKVVLGHGLRQQQGEDPSTLRPLFPKPTDELMFMLAGALYFDARV